MSNIKASYFKYQLVFKKPAMTSRGPLHSKTSYFLRFIDLDGQATGLGECAPLPGLSLDGGADFERKVAALCEAINRGERSDALDVTGSPALAFGLEMARLDWKAGESGRLFDTGFSRGQSGLPTHGLIWMSDRDDILSQIERKIGQGFTVIKMKIGALDFAIEREMLAEIRQRYPAEQIVLRLDANGAFTPDNALARLEQLAPFEVFALEQPLKPGQPEALADVCRHSPVPIALDEELIGIRTLAEKERLLKTIRPQHLVLKPSLLGGFSAAEEWVDLADHFGLGWWVNTMLESNIGLSAICQWASNLPGQFTHGLGTGQLFSNNISGPLQLRGPALWYDPNVGWDLSAASIG